MAGWQDDNDQTKLTGGTDGTSIGNVSDALKVSIQSTVGGGILPSWKKSVRYDDMAVISRNTSLSGGVWTTVYTYTGSGFVAGIIANVETFATGWSFRLKIDTETIFEFLDTDLASDTVYDVDDITDFSGAFIGVTKGTHDRFVWHGPVGQPVYFASSVTFEVKKTGSSKKWQAGLIVLSKDS